MVFNRLKKTRKYVRNLMTKRENKNKTKQKSKKYKNKTSKLSRQSVNKVTNDLLDLNSSFTNYKLPPPPSRVIENPSKLSRTAKAIRNVFYTPENTNIDQLKKLNFDPIENEEFGKSLEYVNLNTQKRNDIKRRQAKITQHMKKKQFNKYKPLSNDLIDLRSRNSNKGHKILANGIVNKQMRNMMNKNTSISVSLQHSQHFKRLNRFQLLTEINNMITDLKWSGFTENDAILKFLDLMDETFGKFYDDRFKIIRNSDDKMHIARVLAEWEAKQSDNKKRDNMSLMNDIILYHEGQIKEKRFLYRFARNEYGKDKTYKLVLQYLNKM